ncbi:hypothetical protein [Spirillospora sp. NPDC047279]|uniref:hypothetical protein n=1 Tax=Spirillospora sp. NPDC047279 TaxID=3155478 RepID=UPI0033D00B3F
MLAVRSGSSVLVAGLALSLVPVLGASAAADGVAQQRIVIDPIAVPNWDADITVSGRLQRRTGDDAWGAAPGGTQVRFDGAEGPYETAATVAAGGSFRVRLVAGYGKIDAWTPADGEYPAARAKVIGLVSILQIQPGTPDRETNPDYPFVGKKFEVRRVLKARRGEVLPGRTVALYWAPRGKDWSYPKGGWKWLTSGTTGRDGKVVLRATAWKEGWLRTVFAGDASYQAVEDGYGFRTYYQTAITGFNASPEPARVGQWLKLTGRLWRWTSSGGWQPVRGKRIFADYRLKGARQWRHAFCANGGALTDSKGWFRLECQTKKDASWRAYYVNSHGSPDSTSTDHPAISGADYVDVR